MEADSSDSSPFPPQWMARPVSRSSRSSPPPSVPTHMLLHPSQAGRKWKKRPGCPDRFRLAQSAESTHPLFSRKRPESAVPIKNDPSLLAMSDDFLSSPFMSTGSFTRFNESDSGSKLRSPADRDAASNAPKAIQR